MTRTLVILLVLGMAPLVALATPTISLDLRYETTFADISEASTTGAGSVTALSYDQPTDIITLNGANNPNWISRFAVYVSLSGAAAGEDLAANVVGFTLGAGLSKNADLDAGGSNYISATPPTRTYSLQPYTLFSYSDAYTTNDLLALQYTYGAKASWVFSTKGSPLISPEIAPVLLGWVFAQWDGTNGSTLTAFGDGETSWSYFTGNDTGTSVVQVNGPKVAYSDVITFNPVPEPATMALLVLGGLGILSRRRRA